MAWKDNLLDASFRGAGFEVLRTRDKGERALVEHEYPYRPGAEVEDMGRKARRISLTAVFNGPQYEAGLARLVAALEESGPGELVHPVFGSVTVRVASWDIPHEGEQPDYVEVALEFVEAGTDNAFLGATGARGAAEGAALNAEGAAGEASEASGQSFARWLEQTARQYSLADKVDVLNSMHDTLDEYDAIQRAGRSAVYYLDFPSAYLSDLQAAQQTAADPLAVQGGGFRNWQKLSQAFPSRSLTGGTGRSYPAGVSAYAGSVAAGPSTGQAVASPTVSIPSVDAARPAQQADLSTPQGATNAQLAVLANVTQTALLTEQATALLQAEAAAPTLTPQEVEAVVGNLRDRMQDAMDGARIVLPAQDAYAVAQALRDAALALQELGAAVIEQSPPLVTHVVDAPCNLHLLAHRLYGDYRRAAELERLNPAIRNPNFLAAGQEVTGYAR
ncbi:DNA circularization N-terminal domain-containing protein [Nitratidesulfovibrio sp.]|uniref:DNA circularization protein n=1 Tax=Nitratidesulfovibrio sp. TaxID=2802297 RepID=UPI00333FB574